MKSATSNVLYSFQSLPLIHPYRLQQTVMERERAAMAVSLPDDLLLEILVRVKDEPTLFRCATVCKRWRNLVADPSFLRYRWPDQDYCSSLVGFFDWQQQGNAVGLKSYFVPTPRSTLGPGLRALSSFVMVTPAGLFCGAVPLVSRHGLLLVRLDTHGNPDKTIVQLAVCSLLVGTCHMLPPLKVASPIEDLHDDKCNAYAVLTGADCRSNDESSSLVLPSDTSFFKVVIITSDYDELKYSLHTFWSDEGRWSAWTSCFGDTSDIEDYGLFGDTIVCRGMAHWLFRYFIDTCFYVISLNLRTNQISKKKLYFQKDNFLTSHISLTLADNGTLSMLWMQKTGTQLEIWGQQEDQQGVDGTCSEWLCTRMIEQKELGKETQGRKLCVFREKCGILLVNDGQHMYTTDLKTGAMEEVSSWPRKLSIRARNVVTIEMDWPTIFISRLSSTF